MTRVRSFDASRSLENLWLALAFATPLVINPWGESVFTIPKAAFLRTVFLCLLAVWGAARLWQERSSSGSNLSNAATPRPSWRDAPQSSLLLPAAALVAVLMAATLWGADPALSVWGSYERSQGAITLICLPLLALFVASHFPGVAAGRRLFWALIMSLLLPAVYAAVQFFGTDPLGIDSDARSQVASTLGRSNFLSAYAAMMVPLTLSLFRLAQRKAVKIAIATIAGLELGLLIITQTRSGVLAALVGLACWFGLFYRRPLQQKLKSASVRWSAAALFASGLAAALWFANSGASGAARLAIWQGVQKLIARRPLLGYGPDSLEVVFPAVYPPELVYYQGRGVNIDRAHNLILDWTVSLGILGLCAAAAVLFVVARSGWKTLQRSVPDPTRNLLVIGALAAIAGNLAGNLLSFDVIPTMVCSWLLAAMVVGLVPRDPKGTFETATDLEDGEATNSQRALPIPIKILGTTLILVLLAGAIWFLNARPLVADTFARSSAKNLGKGDFATAAELADRAVATFPHQPEFRRFNGIVRLQAALQGEQEEARSAHLTKAEQLFEQALAKRPRDYLYWESLAKFQGTVALQFDRTYLAKAEASWQTATELAPNHALLYNAWGRLRLSAGDTAGAATLLRKAVDLDTTDADAWQILGDIEVVQRPANALVHYRQAAKHAPDRAEPIIGVARAYWFLGQPELAKRTALEALKIDEGSATARLLLEEFSLATDAQTQPPNGEASADERGEPASPSEPP